MIEVGLGFLLGKWLGLGFSFLFLFWGLEFMFKIDGYVFNFWILVFWAWGFGLMI